MAISVNGIIATKEGSEDFLSHDNWIQFVELAHKIGCFIWGRKTYDAVTKWKGDYLNDLKDVKKVAFSPSERAIVDYRNIKRDGYTPFEVHFYGIRDDKIINARILDCRTDINCYFDRAYFLNNNDVFVISEFSRNIKENETIFTPCLIDNECTYTIKVHVIDLINNKRLVYESKPFNIILSQVIPEL